MLMRWKASPWMPRPVIFAICRSRRSSERYHSRIWEQMGKGVLERNNVYVMSVLNDKLWFLWSFLPQICLWCSFFFFFFILVWSQFSLMLSRVVHRWKKKSILQSFYVNIPWRMCLFSKCKRLGFFCEHSLDEKLLGFFFSLFFFFLFFFLPLCFGPKFSDGVILLFLVICFPLRKSYALRLFHGISMEAVITALMCLLFFFSSFLITSPVVAQSRWSSVDHQMNFWSKLSCFVPQNVSEDWIVLWCCGFWET